MSADQASLVKVVPASGGKSSGVPYAFQKVYVRLMMWLVARLLAAASAVDPVVRKEVLALPEGFSFTMRVRSGVAGMGLRRDGDRLKPIRAWDRQQYPLVFEYKHVTHAFLVLGFVEGTAVAFANDRITVDGNTSTAMKIIRGLNRMEVVVLPRIIAERAVKSYPDIGLVEKLGLAARVYGRLILDLFGADR
jgi:hypothetical protein